MKDKMAVLVCIRFTYCLAPPRLTTQSLPLKMERLCIILTTEELYPTLNGVGWTSVLDVLEGFVKNDITGWGWVFADDFSGEQTPSSHTCLLQLNPSSQRQLHHHAPAQTRRDTIVPKRCVALYMDWRITFLAKEQVH